MKNSTCNVLRVTVSTVKRSQAMIEAA